MTIILAQQFVDQPLLLKTTYEGAENDHAIHCAGHLIGRIMLTPMSGGAEIWLWTITGPYLPPELQPSHGRADTLAEAKKAFREKFDAWLAWALEQAGPVPWHGARV
jgi:hypothetical protein